MSFGNRPQTPDIYLHQPPPTAADTIQALDARRQAQIANQKEVINRLLHNGSYDDDMARLHTELAEAHARISEALGKLEMARARFRNEHVANALRQIASVLAGADDE